MLALANEMRSMKRQRLFKQAARTMFAAASLFAGLAVFAPSARAVQLFIDRSFVVANDGIGITASPTNGAGAYCSYTNKNHFVCYPHFYVVNVDSYTCISPDCGDISNDPEIQFAQTPPPANINQNPSSYEALGTLTTNYINSSVFLCASIGYQNENTAAGGTPLDMVEMEIFQFKDGANPLDPTSTPPLRTFFIDSPDYMGANTTSTLPPKLGSAAGGYCVLFDGSINVQTELGKINGQYGFRVTAQTNQMNSQTGNVVITTQRAYPAGATLNSDSKNCPFNAAVSTYPFAGCFVPQKPVTVDVTDIHVVRTSPTVLGQITGVNAEPYGVTYRLSKDALTTITVSSAASNQVSTFRTIVPALPRTGEGQGAAPVLNGDFWDGRDNSGNLMPYGDYLLTLQAVANDQFGTDLSAATTRQISLDPLILTDIRSQPLLAGSTSLAILSYVLTEPATVYVDIYPPNTQFQNLNSVNDPALDWVDVSTMPVKNFGPNIGGQAVTPIRHLQEIKAARTTVTTFWDGRDNNGNAVCTDGNYVYVIYAALPSSNGKPYNGSSSDTRIWTQQAKNGTIGVLRGMVGISQISPVTTAIGANPPLAALNPYSFRYTLSRDAITNMSIYDNTGATLVKTLVSNVERTGLFANQETWQEPVSDSGNWVSSGTYIVQLTAADPLCPMKVSTVSASFPVDPYRITDLATTPLLSGTTGAATATISYQLSQPMNVALNIYPPGTTILNSSTTWPPCGLNTGSCSNVVNSQGSPVLPIRSITGMRPSRLKITEFWDGRDPSGVLMPDGSYVFTLAAQSTTTPQYFAMDRTFGSLIVAQGSIIFTTYKVDPNVPRLFNSSVTVTLPPYTISYALSRQSSVTIQVLNSNPSPQIVRTLISGFVRDGGVLLQDVWDGKDDHGNFMSNGFYVVRTLAFDPSIALVPPSTAQLTVSYEPVRIFDVAIAPLGQGAAGAQIFYQVSETMKVAVKIYRPGTVFDPTGVPIPPESVSLVKRIVGVRPALSQITETWDGTDLRLGVATDGTYKFKVVGSTDITAIDNLTGNVLNSAALSADQLVNDLAVVRDGSLSPKSDFETNTYVYPNPVAGDSANFVIFSPFQGIVTMKLYTMNGDLVLEKNFGETAADQYVLGPNGFVWNRQNQAGRRVARGVYYAVIRVEETLGGQSVLQTVKRILIK